MSKLLSRLAGIFSSRTLVGVDRTGNKYFTRQEPVDGIMKEKRWVTFKGEDDPTTIPVEWICWLNGQRKKAPTPEEMAEMEARRERVKLNVALLKKQEEEERKSKEGSTRQSMRTGKVGGPGLKSFIQQFPAGSVEGTRKKQRKGNQLNLELRRHLSLQNHLDLANLSNQGHGNHQYDRAHPIMYLLQIVICHLFLRPINTIQLVFP